MPQRKERIVLICPECGIEFQRLQCQIRKGGKKFCSATCRDNHRKHGSELHCAMCDSSFYRRFGEQDLGEKVNQFCSRDCYMTWRILQRKRTTYPKIGAIHEHRIVAEAILGRRLLPGEVVHHIDLNKHNVHPLNLAVFPSQSEHMRCHYGKMSDEELRKFRLQ